MSAECEVCGAPSTVHVCEYDDGIPSQRHLCDKHAREVVGADVPSKEQMAKAMLGKLRRIIDFMREHRRFPSPTEASGIHVPATAREGDVPDSAEFRQQLQYLENQAQFIEEHGRFPEENEIEPDPF